MSEKRIGFFARYLTLWVALCIVSGVVVAILIWIMIYPMMLKVDFRSIVNARRKPKGIIVTLVINWLIKPYHHLSYRPALLGSDLPVLHPREPGHLSMWPARFSSARRWCFSGVTFPTVIRATPWCRLR